MTKEKCLSLRLPEDLHRAIEQKAASEDRSLANAARQLLAEAVRRSQPAEHAG
jgi:hypothetical protein